MKTKLLIVEDEAAIRDMIRFALPVEEFELMDAENTTQTVRLLADQIPDLIILDWMLPGKSGIDFIQWIKKQENLKDIPIIMLTAKAEEENKIMGLMSGADDYITKPFSPKELIARIKSVLRRGTLVSPNSEIKIRSLVLNTDNHKVSVGKDILPLTSMEYKMLYFFMRHPNKTYTRDQLITQIWGVSVYIDDRSVDVQIRRLRDKLKNHGCHDLIKSVRGVGYQFSQDNDE